MAFVNSSLGKIAVKIASHVSQHGHPIIGGDFKGEIRTDWHRASDRRMLLGGIDLALRVNIACWDTGQLRYTLQGDGWSLTWLDQHHAADPGEINVSGDLEKMNCDLCMIRLFTEVIDG